MIIGVSGKICSGKDTVYKIIQYLTSTSVRWTIPFEKMNADHTMDNTAWNRISNWENKKFADKLKQCVSIITGIPKVDLEKEEVKTKLLGEEWTRYGYADSFYRDMNGTPIMNNKQCSKEEYIRQYKINEQTAYKHEYTVREILQLFGTEVGRQIHYNVWVNALFSNYKVDSPGNNPMQMNISEDKVTLSPIDWNSNLYPNWVITDVRFPNELKAIKDRCGITIRINRNNSMLDSFQLKNRNHSITTAIIHPSETALDDAIFDYTIDNNGTIEELVEKVKEILIKEKII